MKINLAFKKPTAEEHFLNSKTAFQIKSFKFVSALLLLQIAQKFFLIPAYTEFLKNPIILIYFLILAIMVLFLILLCRRYPSLSARAISLGIFLTSVASTEILHQYAITTPNSYWLFIIIGINGQVLIIFLLLTKIPWIQSLTIIGITNIFTWVRAFKLIDDYQEIPKISLFFFCVQIVFIMCFSYFLEFEERKSYMDVESKSLQLKAFEEIMTNALPNSIIMMKNDTVLFYNNFTQKNFEISNSSQIIEILHTIKVVRKRGFYEKGKKKHEGEEKSSFTLYELYKDCEYYLSNSSTCLSPGFNCVEGEIGSFFQENTKIYSIQLGPSYWKNELGILIIINDISHIRSYYKTLDGYKDNLMATVAHDLRAPLNGILGMMGLLLEETVEEPKREKINISIVSAKMMQNMINDILDFSLISKGKLRLKFEKVNVSTLVEETAKILRLQACMKGLDLEVENSIHNREENHIFDGNRVRQVLFNLIGNAIKYTKKGKVVIRIREESPDSADPTFITQFCGKSKFIDNFDEIKEENENCGLPGLSNPNSIDINGKLLNSFMLSKGRLLVFEVEDTGIGIKPEDMNRLFKLFSRVTAGHDNDMGGIGLGLAISQSLVMMMNSGRIGAVIKVESTFGKGSVFKFPIYVEAEQSESLKEVLDEKYKLPFFTKSSTLPLITNNESHQGIRHDTNNIQSEIDFLVEKNGKTEILVVDDDQLNLLVASKYLKGDQFSLVSGTNGEEAIKIVTENAEKGLNFDVIFMDCNMPIMDGYEAAKKLKVMMRDKKISWTPIVALTGNNLETDDPKFKDSGMDLYLSKPYMKTEMIKMIDEAIKLKIGMEFKNL